MHWIHSPNKLHCSCESTKLRSNSIIAVLFCFPNSEVVFWYTVKNFTISCWVSNMFLHETAKSRKVCGYAGNAHHSTFSCQKKQTKSVSGLCALNGFSLRQKRGRNRQTEGPVILDLLWKCHVKTIILCCGFGEQEKREEREGRKERKERKEGGKKEERRKERNPKEKNSWVWGSYLCFPVAKLRTFWESSIEAENPIYGLDCFFSNWSLMYTHVH